MPMAYTQMSHTTKKMLSHSYLSFALQINTVLLLSWRGLVWEDSKHSAYFSFFWLLNIHQLCQHISLEIAILEMHWIYVHAFPVIRRKILMTHCSSPPLAQFSILWKLVERNFGSFPTFFWAVNNNTGWHSYSSLQSQCVLRDVMKISTTLIFAWVEICHPLFPRMNVGCQQDTHSSFNSVSKTEQVTKVNCFNGVPL